MRDSEPSLSRIPTDARILEIGPGLGRSLVFFSKKLGWRGDQLHAYEGDGHTTRYTSLGPALTIVLPEILRSLGMS